MKIHQLKKSKFGKDTIWLIFGQFVAMGAGFTLNVYIGYRFDMNSLGLFNQSLAIYLILAILFSLGLNNTLLKKISEKKQDINHEGRLFTNNLLITIVASTSLSAIFMFTILKFPNLLPSDELASTLPSMFLALPLFCVNKNFAALYSGKRDQKKYALQRVFRWSILVVVFLAGDLANSPIQPLMFAFLFIEAILVVINSILCRKYFNFNISIHIIQSSLYFGLGSYISEITSTVNRYADVVIVAYFLTGEEAGQYSFVAYFVRTLYIFPGVVMQNISPIVSHHWQRKTIADLNQKLRKVRSVNIIVLTLQLGALILLFRILIEMQEGFESSFGGFLIALVGTFLFAQIYWGGSVLIMTERLRANFYRTVLILVANVTICVLGSYTMGFIGSSIALSMSALISFLLLRSFVQRKTGIQLI